MKIVANQLSLPIHIHLCIWAKIAVEGFRSKQFTAQVWIKFWNSNTAELC